MARYPGASWRPISGHTDGPMRSHTGAVLHVNESNGNLYSWVAGNNGMSCHFEVYKSGAIEQYLDTDVSSWCQMAGNADYLSIETEGYTTEPLAGPQLTAIVGLYAWLHALYGIPLRLAEAPGQAGLGWHGMGGAAWGGHPACPGDLRRAQRQTVLDRISSSGSGGFLMALTDAQQNQLAVDAHRAAAGIAPPGPAPFQEEGEVTERLRRIETVVDRLAAKLGVPTS